MATKYIKSPTFTKEFLYEKVKGCESQKCVLVKFMFETGIRASEVSSILSITGETITIRGAGNKVRDAFHNINTTCQVQKFNVSTSTLRRWIKEVLGNEYTSTSIRRSHMLHLLNNGANSRMVQLQCGYSSVKTAYKAVEGLLVMNNRA